MFFQQLLKVNYLAGVNLQSYCYYFRKNKEALEETVDVAAGQTLMHKTTELVKVMLYKQAMLPIADVLFNENRQCLNKWKLAQLIMLMIRSKLLTIIIKERMPIQLIVEI